MHPRMRKLRLVLAASAIPLLGTACATGLRDAATVGVYDFVSGSITEALMAILPIAQAIGAA